MASDPKTQKPARLRDLVFEDIYIADTGEYTFVQHDGRTHARPPGYDGPLPDAEVRDEILRYVRQRADRRDEFALRHDEIMYRVAVIRAQKTWYVLRRAQRQVPPLSSFHGVDLFWDSILNLGQSPGLIVATGPTGSGKSTFLGALLKTYLETFGGVGVCIEDPPELILEGSYPKGRCFQLSVEENDFPKGLRRALRYRPRYILVGELRSQEAAMTAIQASITGHTVLCTVHGGSVPQAILNLATMAAPHGRTDLVWRSISEGLQMVVHMQRQAQAAVPTARMFIVPAVNSVEGTRAKIRNGMVEHLQGDMDLAYARVENRGGR